MAGIRWTKQAVIAAIQHRHASGELLSRAWAEDRPLFRAAVRWFGNWSNALRAAGFEPKPRRRWSEERVVQELLFWHRQPGTRNLRRDDPALADAVRRQFGTLAAAFEALGLDPKDNRWTDRRVIRKIQDYYIEGRSLSIKGCGDNRLAAAAKRRFGGWASAVEAAGLSGKYSPPPPQRVWTRRAVAQAILAWRQQGRPLTDVNRQDTGLYSAAKKHFGTWRQALLAVGIEPPRKQWDKQRVLAALRERQALGLPINSSVFVQDSALAGAATRLFGNFRQAVAEAGVHWTPPIRKAG